MPGQVGHAPVRPQGRPRLFGAGVVGGILPFQKPPRKWAHDGADFKPSPGRSSTIHNRSILEPDAAAGGRCRCPA